MRRRGLFRNNEITQTISERVTHLFRFEEAAGSTTLTESRKGLTATNEGGVLGQTGVNGNAIRLASNNYFICDYPEEFRMWETVNTAKVGIPFSFGCWIKKTTAFGINWLLYKRTSSTNPAEYWCYMQDGRMKFYIAGQGGEEMYCFSPYFGDLGISTGQWFHYLFTHDGSMNSSGMKGYVNGVAGTEHSNNSITSLVANNTGIRVGNSDWSASYPLGGDIDQFFFAKGSQFSEEDASALYNNGNGITL